MPAVGDSGKDKRTPKADRLANCWKTEILMEPYTTNFALWGSKSICTEARGCSSKEKRNIDTKPDIRCDCGKSHMDKKGKCRHLPSIAKNKSINFEA